MINQIRLYLSHQDNGTDILLLAFRIRTTLLNKTVSVSLCVQAFIECQAIEINIQPLLHSFT